MKDTKTRITKARIHLLLEKCFYGNLALSLKMEENNDVQTMATDGKHIFYNKEFIDSLSDDDLQFILCHELIHNILYHLTRRENREQGQWNLAIDFAVNNILYKDFGFLPKGALFKKEFENMTAEAIYNKLPEMNGKGQKNGSYKRYEKGDGQDNITVEISKDGIKVNGEKIKQYDEHKDIRGSKSEIDELEKEWKIQTVKAYEQAKMQGKNPAGMDIFIKELLQPKLDWRNMMLQFIVSTAKNDFTWLPPNRKFIHRDMYFPSVTGESLGDVAVIIDDSGSCITDQQRFFSECNALLQQYEINLHLIVCDMQINSYRVYEQGEQICLEQKGGGRTNLVKAFEFIKEKSINPNVIVCLTDGQTDFPKKEDFPTLWVISKNGVEEDKIPFGMKVKIDE